MISNLLVYPLWKLIIHHQKKVYKTVKRFNLQENRPSYLQFLKCSAGWLFTVNRVWKLPVTWRKWGAHITRAVGRGVGVVGRFWAAAHMHHGEVFDGLPPVGRWYVLLRTAAYRHDLSVALWKRGFQNRSGLGYKEWQRLEVCFYIFISIVLSYEYSYQ